MNRDELFAKLQQMSQSTLSAALCDIYARLCCDEENQHNPEESTAAHSAADFVESCGTVFEMLMSRDY